MAVHAPGAQPCPRHALFRIHFRGRERPARFISVSAMLSDFGTSASWMLAVLGSVALAAFVLLRRRARGSRQDRGNGPGFERMPLAEFEALVRESMRKQGYSPIQSSAGGARPERGELLLRRDRETVLVQCRHWRERKVKVEAVEALQRAMGPRGAAGGLILTTGRFSREATHTASGSRIRLLDGPALRDLLASAASSAALRGTR